MGIFFLSWLLFSILVGAYAGNKGRSGIGFFLLSLLLSPLIGFLIAVVSSPIQKKVAGRSGLKKCPECAEYVHEEAHICRFCRYEFAQGVVVYAPKSTSEHVVHDLPRPAVGPTTWGPKLGSGAANLVKWCKRNPVWPLLLLLILVIGTAILSRVPKPSNEQVATQPPVTKPDAPTSIAQKPFVTPTEFFLKPVVERGLGGEIYISGTTNFPDGMKMSVILGSKKAMQDAFVAGGQFRSGPLYQNVQVPITGSQPLELYAYFNGAWQNKEVLSLLGEGGKNLHGKLFKLADPDVFDSEKWLDAKFTVSMPPITSESNAINIVKHATLTVPGEGRSATDIEKNLALFTNPGTGVTPAKGWLATPAGSNVYNVSYDFIDGDNGEKQAIWSVNVATNQVKYVNEAAKLFSWTPKD